MKPSIATKALVVAAVTLLWTTVPSSPRVVHSGAGADIVVNTSDDVDDGTCDSSHCSLREALRAAWLQAGPNTITFAIPTIDPGYDAATGAWTIEPDGGFVVYADTTIDGSVTSMSPLGGRSSRPGIEIDGTDQIELGITGLRLEERVTLRGLVVNHFQYAIWVGGENALVEECYIGTDPTGTQPKPNGADGILVSDGVWGAIIQHNLISSSSGGGIRLFGESTSDNIIRGNLIGCDVTATAALPHGYYGVEVHAGAHDNVIGPDSVIAFNNISGLWVSDAGTVGNTITENSIHGNGGWGIRLISGGNNELAEPVVLSASPSQVSGTACNDCVIEVFSDAGSQGQFYEGTTAADHAGNWVFTKPGGLSGPFVTATATDAAGNTSGFSAPVCLVLASPTATSTPTLTPTPTRTATPPANLAVAKLVDLDEASAGDELHYTLVIMNDMLIGPDPGLNVQLEDVLPDVVELVAGSLSPQASYDADTHAIYWTGEVPRGGSVQIDFRALLTPAATEWPAVTNTMLVTDAFGRVVQASAHTRLTPPTPTAPAAVIYLPIVIRG